MTSALLLAATLTTGLAALGTTFVVGMRTKTPIVLKAVRRSGRAIKPLVLRSAGSATIRFDARSHSVVEPQVVRIDAVDESFAPKERWLHRQFRVREALTVHTAESAGQ